MPSFKNRVTLGEGLTPVSRVEEILVKNEKFNPTGLYSDRASALISSFLRDIDAKKVYVGYSEEFTKSLIYYLAGVSLYIVASSIFDIDPEDIMLFASKGLDLVYEYPNDAAVVYYENPLTIEGLKTIVFELYEKSVKTENIVVPAKSGILALSLYKGIEDLNEAGIETSFQVTAATLKGFNPQILRNLRRVKVFEVSEVELYEAYRKLLRKGFKIKPLAALSYHVAEIIGNSVAVVTMGYKTRTTGRGSDVKKLVLDIVSRKPLITAYEIWKEKPVYTLRAVYKAIKSMELNGEICFEVKTRGVRKVKLYKLC
ncbi:MAG: pyridoxal-5'-phosphate-dependent protein subunit beta [Desulfurococcus sp.]|uniref:pyridoxal-phosphate dependent enzyme n=1 Tax=Desulfurococcus sp. TaxID=51678 RepID=UPI00316B54E2